MVITIVGEGEVLIRFIDRNGQTLMQEKLVVSGSLTVEGRRTIDLAVKTIGGSVPLAPVLIKQSNPKQRVTKATWKVSDNGDTWSHLAVVGSRLYLKDGSDVLCYDLGGGK